jgi:hypothetical protein
MGLKDVDFDAAFRRLAEKRVEDAIKDGKFDLRNLPGYGKDIEIDQAPADENARMLWWALKIMKNADVVPDEVLWRKAVDRLKADIHRATDEQHLASLVGKVNELVHKLNTLGTNAISLGMAPVDYDAELKRLRERLAS